MLNSDKLNSLDIEDIRNLETNRWRTFSAVSVSSVQGKQLVECWKPFELEYGKIKHMFTHKVGERDKYHIICLKCVQGKYFLYSKWSTFLDKSLFILEEEGLDEADSGKDPPNISPT